MSTHRWASQLVAKAATTLAEVGLQGISPTTDVSAAPSALAAGHLVITVRPPTLDLPTWDEILATFEVVLITGPASDPVRAWERLDEALFPLLEPLAVERVAADAFIDSQNTTYPALVLTTTSHHEKR